MMLRPRVRAIVTAVLLAAHATAARGQSPPEYALKGAFVFNVANFVEWPPTAFQSPTTPIRVAVVSAHPLPEFVNALHAKTIRGRSVTVEGFEHAEQLGAAHIIFVAADAAAEQRAVIKGVNGRPVLTIAEQAIESPSETVIAIGVSQTRLAFAVNLDAADALELKISPNLLKLAKSVRSSRAKTR